MNWFGGESFIMLVEAQVLIDIYGFHLTDDGFYLLPRVNERVSRVIRLRGSDIATVIWLAMRLIGIVWNFRAGSGLIIQMTSGSTYSAVISS